MAETRIDRLNHFLEQKKISALGGKYLRIGNLYLSTTLANYTMIAVSSSEIVARPPTAKE